MTLVDPGEWGELTGDRPIPRAAKILLDDMPEGFVDDGCSSFPDMLGRIASVMTHGAVKPWVLRWACRVHDWDACTRAHPPGTMTDARQRLINKRLRVFLVEYLPLRWRWLGWAMRAGLWFARGFGWWDSCDLEARGAMPSQLAQGLCRHALPAPEWMTPVD